MVTVRDPSTICNRTRNCRLKASALGPRISLGGGAKSRVGDVLNSLTRSGRIAAAGRIAVTSTCIVAGLCFRAYAASYIDIQVGSHTTVATSNSEGVLAGSYASPDQSGEIAFVRAIDGTVTTFQVPGERWTGAIGISDSNSVTGNYFNLDSVSHGFVRTPDGTIATFDVPGAGKQQGQGTTPSAIRK